VRKQAAARQSIDASPTKHQRDLGDDMSDERIFADKPDVEHRFSIDIDGDQNESGSMNRRDNYIDDDDEMNQDSPSANE